jgi:hypothetical protein
VKFADIVKFQRGDYWVSKRYQLWVTEQRDLEAERDALLQIMTRPPRIRINTFSASAAGRCPRERMLAFMGAPKTRPDERTMNIFANGDYVHLRFQVAGIVGGWLVQAEVPVYLLEYNLTGTMDGLLANGHGLEVKSINDRGFKEISQFGPKSDHLDQVSAYMLARPDIQAFHIVYENKNLQEIKEFEVTRAELTERIERVRQDLEALNAAVERGELVPMLPECVAESGRFARCPYKKICPIARFASVAERRSPIRVSSSTPNVSSE